MSEPIVRLRNVDKRYVRGKQSVDVLQGLNLDIPQGDLDVGLASSDNEVKRKLAQYLEVPEAKLRDYIIDRHETGNLTVRPEAVFG